MKINKLRFIGGNTVDFPMMGANPAGPFILKGVDGLGPPDTTVSIAQTVLEGGFYQGKRSANRQVVARVGLQPEWDTGQTPEELRSMLYKLMTVPFGDNALFQVLEDATVVAEVYGEVSKIDPSIFTKDPEVQITLDCFSPYLKAPSLVSQQPAKSIASGASTFTVQNGGDAKAGFWLSVTLNAGLGSGFIPYLSDAKMFGQRIGIEGITWAAGDKLTLDTRDRQRGIWRTPSGSSTKASIINNLTDDSVWLQLHADDNTLGFNFTTWDWNPPGFSHTPTYLGV